MAASKPHARIRNVRGQTDPDTHKALRIRQLQMEGSGRERPDLTAVVTVALKEWAQSQP